MKKNFYLFASLFLSALTLLPACSDDEKEKAGEPQNEEVKTVTLDATAYDQWVYFKFADKSSVVHPIEPLAGTYTGEVSVVVSGQDMGSAPDLKMEVTRVTADSVVLVLKDFNFASHDMGDITSGAKVTVTADGWQLQSEKWTLDGMTVSGTGLIAGRKITLDLSIQPKNMPMPIAAAYAGELETDGNVDETSFDWDIAIHRYDVKTNAGSALATTEKELSAVAVLPSAEYVADVQTDSLTYDMTHMMQGAVAYAPGHVNEVLNGWLQRVGDGMPPQFATSDLVYLVKTKSGACAKIKWTDYTSDEGTNGHITFEYVYPFQ